MQVTQCILELVDRITSPLHAATDAAEEATRVIDDTEEVVERLGETSGKTAGKLEGLGKGMFFLNQLKVLDKAIETLKKHFDYVIMDTAPIGMVTDTLLIGRVADLSVYVCRADYTHKAEYTLINELSIEKKLPNLCTVINGVDLKKRKYGYYYGYGKYGKHYGYGKRYGYGYGYGE